MIFGIFDSETNEVFQFCQNSDILKLNLLNLRRVNIFKDAIPNTLNHEKMR